MKNCICVTFLVSLWSSLATLGFAFAPTIHNRGSLQRESFSGRLRQSRLLGQRTWYHDNGPEFNTYVQNIFQYDLLSPAEEVILTKQIQRGVAIETAFKTLKEKLGRSPTANEWTEAVGVESIETIRTQLKRAAKSKSALINANVRLVLGICKKYRYNDISFQDLVQEGTMGLNKAAEKFDPSKGFRFSTYATWWVKEAVRKALARESSTVRMPAHFWDAINLYKRTKSDLYKEHNRAPTMEEIACKCKLPLHKVELCAEHEGKATSLDGTVSVSNRKTGSQSVTQIAVAEMVADPKVVPEADAHAVDLAQGIKEILKCLPKREAEILRLRHGLADGEAWTLEAIGERYGLTRERVRQLESKAMKQLRTLNSYERLPLSVLENFNHVEEILGEKVSH
mmetsp:Transcript_30868/g.51214  ORF Transcript_30868/g.51214 Transcript_30868/m.51214 type:complete len:397 (+) Transcript_30868:103-1293(+)